MKNDLVDRLEFEADFHKRKGLHENSALFAEAAAAIREATNDTPSTDREAVERWIPATHDDGGLCMKPNKLGSWVCYEDYSALLARAEAAEAETAALREGQWVAVKPLEEPWTPVHAGCSTALNALADKGEG